VFVPGKPFQPGVMFAGKERSLPKRGATESLRSCLQTLDKAGEIKPKLAASELTSF
jgi:hypothetical protein